MPTIQELTTAVSVATTNYNNAVSARDAAFSSAKTAHDALFNCVKGKGETNNCPDGQPLGTNQYPPFGSLGNPGACRICNSVKDCKTDCCKEETCVARMDDYNAKINTYNIAVNNVASKKSILDAANSNLASNPEGAAIIAAGVNTAQSQATRRNLLIFGIIVVIVIAAILIYRKFFK